MDKDVKPIRNILSCLSRVRTMCFLSPPIRRNTAIQFATLNGVFRHAKGRKFHGDWGADKRKPTRELPRNGFRCSFHNLVDELAVL